MPTSSSFVIPELFKVIRGVRVFHTYKNDDMDQGVNKYSYTLDPYSDDHRFDIRLLEVPSLKLLDGHPPFQTGTNPVWSNASETDRERIKSEWKKWQEVGENDAIATIIAEALEANLLDMPEPFDDDEQEIKTPKCYLTDGGNVYFINDGELWDAPVMTDGTFGMSNAGPVGFEDGISQENCNYCRAVEAALHLLEKRNISEGMDA
jgi:hypothetical protein